MKQSVNKSIRAITEGAIFTAAYALLALLGKYLSSDSMLYYFTPLPIALYVARNKFTYSIAVFFASVLLSFLFVEPILALFIIMPNIIVGFIFGCLEKYSKLKFINYAVMIISCLLVSFLSIHGYELITGIDYFEDVTSMFEEIGKLFTVDLSIVIPLFVEIISIIVLVVDAVIKSVLLYLIFAIIVKRLKLIPGYSLKIKMPYKYHFTISLSYILVYIIANLTLSYMFENDHVVIKLFCILFLSLLLLFSFYLIYQFIMFLRFKFKKLNIGLFILVIIASMILSPISILGGIVLNFINYNILLDMI